MDSELLKRRSLLKNGRDAVIDYVIERIASAPIEKDPYPYFYLDRVFPDDFYQELIEAIPDPSYYQALSMSGAVRVGTYVQRLSLPLEAEWLSRLPFGHLTFWSRLADQLKSALFISMLLKKFQAEFKERFQNREIRLYPDLSLISDSSDYAIGPHTDHPQKVLTLLFYFPETSKQRHLGTSVYLPKDRSFRCAGFKHHSFEGFTKWFTAPFIPNSAFGFFKSDCSFHGVEPIGKQKNLRRSMSYQLLLGESAIE